jgi:hypothetical protein
MNLTKQQLKQIVEEELATLTDGAIIWHDDSEKKKKEEEELRAFKRARRARLDKWDREREHDGYGGLTSRKSYTEGTLTKEQLEQIIREELLPLLSEVGLEHDPTGEDGRPYKPAPFRPDPFTPEGQDLARKTPTYVQGPARIYSDRGEGRIQHLTTVKDGESVFIKFDEEQ